MGDKNTFGRWLKQRREPLDLTQHALAEQTGYTVEPSASSKEAGSVQPARTRLLT